MLSAEGIEHIRVLARAMRSIPDHSVRGPAQQALTALTEELSEESGTARKQWEILAKLTEGTVKIQKEQEQTNALLMKMKQTLERLLLLA